MWSRTIVMHDRHECQVVVFAARLVFGVQRLAGNVAHFALEPITPAALLAEIEGLAD